MSKILLGENREGGDVYLENTDRGSMSFELKGCCETFCLRDSGKICGVVLEGDVILSEGDGPFGGLVIAGICESEGRVFLQMEIDEVSSLI